MSSIIYKQYKAAVVQSEPGWFDLEESVNKTIHWINEAGKKGCKLIAFPETWIPGYPFWMWQISYQQSLPFLKSYRQNALPANSPQMSRIRAAARDNKIFVSLGFSEIDLATLYIAQVLISPAGEVLNHRRKIKPTHVERLIFGEGTGDSVDCVVETEIGRLGHLNCWENLNPYMKAVAAARGEQIHVAAWPVYPPVSTKTPLDPYTNVADPLADVVTPAYAIETATYVLAPFQLLTTEGLKKNTPPSLWKEGTVAPACGFSRAYGPDGSRVVEDPDRSFDGLLIVDIDLEENHLPKALLDLGGHYTRPDLIRLLVDKRPKALIQEVEGIGADGLEQTYRIQSTLQKVGLDKPLEEGLDVAQAEQTTAKSVEANGTA